MRRGARDSQVVNNFFTFATIVIISIVLTLYSKYFSNKQELLKKEIVKLQCEKEIFTFSEVLDEKFLNNAIKTLDEGFYKLDGGMIESEYMKSNLDSVISLKDVDKFYMDSISILPKKEMKKYLKIRYEVIENDKKNPSKKDKNKLNAGALVSSFVFNSKEIFRVYTNFSFMYKNAIKDRVDCSIKVFRNHASK